MLKKTLGVIFIQTKKNGKKPSKTAELLSLFDTKSLSIPLSYEPLVIEWIDNPKEVKTEAWKLVKRSGRYEVQIRAMLKKIIFPKTSSISR